MATPPRNVPDAVGSPDSAEAGVHESPRKALEKVGFYFEGWTTKLTDTSVQMCYALIGANWVVFGSVGNILRNNYAKASLLFVMLTLGINMVGAWFLSESLRRRFEWAEGHDSEWTAEFNAAKGKRVPFPFTKAQERLPFWLRQVKGSLPLISAILLIIGAVDTGAVDNSRSRVQEAAVPQMWKPVTCVGPFTSGKVDQIEQLRVSEWTPCTDITSASSLIRGSCERRDECEVMLVGSADKRPLRRDLEIEFGSNEGLARARAEWVREQFMYALSLDPNRFLVLTVGPREHGVAGVSPELQHDRSVQVYLLGPEAEPSKSPTKQ